MQFGVKCRLKRNIGILWIGIKCFKRDLIYDVVSHCAWNCVNGLTLADLEGVEPAPPPPWAKDWRRHHGTPDMWQRYCIIAKPSPVYHFKRVKHGTQNITNDCHQWLSVSFRVHQIRFRPRLRSGPRWGSLYSAPTDPLAGLRGPTSKESGGKRERGEGKGDRPPFANSWIRPL